MLWRSCSQIACVILAGWPGAVLLHGEDEAGKADRKPLEQEWLHKFPVARATLTVTLPIVGAMAIVALLLVNRKLGREVARRRETDAALKASEERWSFALEGNRDGVWDWNVQTNEVFFSKQWKAMLGYGEQELENRFDEWASRLHPDDFSLVVDEVQRHLRGEIPTYKVEHRVRRKDGTYGWFLARGRIVSCDENGKPSRMVGTQTDVTTWHEAEDQLRESEQKYREIFDHSSDAIFVVDVGPNDEFRYGAFNPANAQFLAKDLGELAGATVDEVMPLASVEKVKESYRRCVSSGHPITFDEHLHFPEGGVHFHTTLVPVRDASGNIHRIIGIARDITDRKRAEGELLRQQEKLEEMVTARTAELSESEARFRALAELIPNHVWSALPDGQLDYVNARATEYFGRTAEQMIGEGWQAIIHPEDLPKTVEQWSHSLQTGDPLHIEYRMLRKDGAFRWHLCRAQPMRNSDGRIVKWFGTTTEIEEQKAIEYALHDAKAAAEEAARTKSSFLARMSHEIRTPMNAILGFTQLLLRDQAVVEPQRQHLETIQRSAGHLLNLINDVLDMSKIEAGHVTLHIESFDLRALLADVEAMFRQRAAEKGLELIFVDTAALPQFVKTDATKLRQVLINLIGNAVKFTAQGRVMVEAFVEHRAGQRLVVEIADNGPGIPEGERVRLFLQFEQTSSGRGTRGGTGLGLAISRDFSRLMGGDITVRSEVGRGSTFRLEVAIESCDGKPAAECIERRVVGLKTSGPAPRVLIADDIYENRELLFQILRYVGFETHQVSNGLEAVAEFESWHPHAILMDIRMPVLDGFEAIRRIRALPGGREVNIIAVTASVLEDERRIVQASGADGSLPKPFSDEDLFEQLRKATGVEYRYAGEETATPPSAPVSVPAPTLTAERVAQVLPAELRERLRVEVIRADLDCVLALLDEAARHDSQVAKVLRRRAEGFDYSGLLELLPPT